MRTAARTPAVTCSCIVVTASALPGQPDEVQQPGQHRGQQQPGQQDGRRPAGPHPAQSALHHRPLPRHQCQRAEPETPVQHGDEPHRAAAHEEQTDAGEGRRPGRARPGRGSPTGLSSPHGMPHRPVRGRLPSQWREDARADDDDAARTRATRATPTARSATRPRPSAPTGTGTSCSRSCASPRPGCRSSPASSSPCRSSSGSASSSHRCGSSSSSRSRSPSSRR